MHAQIAPGGPAIGVETEGDLRLPRPPGVFRRFWARHPRLSDWMIVAFALLVAVPTLTILAADQPTGSGATWTWTSIAVAVLTAVSLLWRRRAPVIVFAVTVAPIAVITPAFGGSIATLPALIGLYSVAVHRSSRAAVWSFAASTACTVAASLLWVIFDVHTLPDAITHIVGTMTLLLIALLIGVNVGNRKRYIEALIDRSRSLAVERDQQAQIAAAAERTRIAREMHDIVSHSLTVVVTLAEGASRTDDPVRSKQASRAIADTARDALGQMRVMLGVLREPGASREEASQDEEDVPRRGAFPPDPPRLGRPSSSGNDSSGNGMPLTPLLDQTPADAVATARRAGLPVTLTIRGMPEGTDVQRLAVLRIVQEGLTNALRYAKEPTAVTVVTDYTGDRVRITIENDGVRRGERSHGAGLGLRGLQERVAALGGTFDAGATGEASWRLHAEFPKEDARD